MLKGEYRLDNGPGTFKFAGMRVRLPILGWVKLREELRFSGRALYTTALRVADRWLVCVPVGVVLPEPTCENRAAVGMDLGVNAGATLSSREKLGARKALEVHIEDLNMRGMLANQALGRKIADIGFCEFRRQLEYKAKLKARPLRAARGCFPFRLL